MYFIKPPCVFFVLNQLYITHTIHVSGVSYIYQNFKVLTITNHLKINPTANQQTYISIAWMRVLGTGKKKGGKKWENLLGSQLRTLSSSQPPRRLVQVPRCVAVNFGPMGLPMVFEKTILEILRYCQQKTLEVVK